MLFNRLETNDLRSLKEKRHQRKMPVQFRTFYKINCSLFLSIKQEKRFKCRWRIHLSQSSELTSIGGVFDSSTISNYLKLSYFLKKYSQCWNLKILTFIQL